MSSFGSKGDQDQVVDKVVTPDQRSQLGTDEDDIEREALPLVDWTETEEKKAKRKSVPAPSWPHRFWS